MAVDHTKAAMARLAPSPRGAVSSQERLDWPAQSTTRSAGPRNRTWPTPCASTTPAITRRSDISEPSRHRRRGSERACEPHRPVGGALRFTGRERPLLALDDEARRIPDPRASRDRQAISDVLGRGAGLPGAPGQARVERSRRDAEAHALQLIE